MRRSKCSAHDSFSPRGERAGGGERSLRALFDVYADFPNIKPVDAKLLCFNDWNLLLKHLDFYDEAFQQREGTLCFAHSRMRCIDEESARGEKKKNHLNFEDFLEAITRLAT